MKRKSTTTKRLLLEQKGVISLQFPSTKSRHGSLDGYVKCQDSQGRLFKQSLGVLNRTAFQVIFILSSRGI